MRNRDTLITGEMLENYYELNKKKKEIEQEMKELKEIFHAYFNDQVGVNQKGQVTQGGFKVQRQIRKSEKYNDETVSRLEALNMNELITVIKKPDDEKIKAAIGLGLLEEAELADCKTATISAAISVKAVTPR